ncbi:hypothetical protein PF005_g30698 [Phytophthora fragariae]|uniref:Ubiquitin-like protease family profile domain-containing protein n=1 Tax=Phytophthora fragariae TaxID=53985 RepID=A0A6A3V8U4_9STRA|nr:hypothetical protein PF005_g30698 [Phytophthora fragariae]
MTKFLAVLVPVLAEANSDHVVVNLGGGKDNPDSGGAKSDSEGDKPDKEADKSDRGGANTDSDAARSGGTVVQKAGVSGDDENCVRSGDESVSGEVSIARKQGADAAQDVNESSGHDECMFGGAGDASSGESAASSGCASDSDDSLFEIDTHEKKTPACPKKQIFFRKRYPKNQVVLEWSGADKYVCLFPRDLNCLLPDQLLTETTLDYFVHRYMKPAPGVLCFCGTDLYRSIEFAWRSKKSAMCGEFDWSAYPYVILIVSGVKHYSLLVVENAMQNGPTGMFHVNSLKGAHDSAYVFNMMRWHLAKERHKYPDLTPLGTYTAGVFDTKPQQSNCVDCGLSI